MDQTLIHLALESEPVTAASFPLPSLRQQGGHDAALLLRDAMVLSLRRGAGPFRGFGQIAVEPRAYQLVPLLMALKLDPVRLLIADDVDIGKTIEAALVDFDYPAAPRCRPVQRSHPLVSVLAETLLERTLAGGSDGPGNGPEAGVLGRVGCWVSAGVQARTAVALLRLRHQLVTQKAGRTSMLLVEEAAALAWRGGEGAALVEGAEALALLLPPPVGDPPAHVRERAAVQALEQLASRRKDVDGFAERRSRGTSRGSRRTGPFASDCGYEGPPFRWDPERRFLLRAELDAAFFHLYGLSRDAADYILDTGAPPA